MKKFITKAIVRSMEIKDKAIKRLSETDGNVLTENAVMIVIAIVLALLIVGWATGFLQNTFLPTVGNRIMGIFDFKG